MCAGQAHEAQAYAKAHVCTHYSRWSGKRLLFLLWYILWSRLDERITGQLSFCTNADTGQRCMCCTARQGEARKQSVCWLSFLRQSCPPAAAVRPTQLLISLASVSRNRPAFCRSSIQSDLTSPHSDNCGLTTFPFV